MAPGPAYSPEDRVWGVSLHRSSEASLGRPYTRSVRRTVGDSVKLARTAKKTSTAMLALPLATAMVLLAGCSGDGEPDASRSSTPGSSPATTAAPSTTSASPTTTTRVDPQLDPSIPAAARLPNHAGALAFVRYFIRRWNLTETGPRPGILTPLCLPSSEACAVYEKEAARLAKAGHRYNGTPITIKSMKIQDAPKARMVDILAVLVQEPSSEVDASGKVFRTAKKKDFGIRFVVLHTGKTWSVNFIQSAQ